MRKDRIPLISGDEYDWVGKWRRILCVFRNRTGLGKKVKHAINRRARRIWKRKAANITEETYDDVF